MKLWLLTQDQVTGLDTYDSVVVAAETADEAQRILPDEWLEWGETATVWAKTPEAVKVKLIGKAAPGTPAGVILASFNAG